jgi:DNA-directed RNA polymerase specialized sigma24 family protein
MSVVTRFGSTEMGAQRVLSLYDRHARELLGFFTRRTRDPQLALDLLSETFLAAFEHRGQCRAGSDGEAAAWLYRIAANRLAAHFRRGAIERLAEAGEGGALTAGSGPGGGGGRRPDPAADPGPAGGAATIGWWPLSPSTPWTPRRWSACER